jgi:hypothetical protein
VSHVILFSRPRARLSSCIISIAEDHEVSGGVN